ncbi:MAG: hypothetical protein QM757_28195 [Paludibaculum sp.]
MTLRSRIVVFVSFVTLVTIAVDVSQAQVRVDAIAAGREGDARRIDSAAQVGRIDRACGCSVGGNRCPLRRRRRIKRCSWPRCRPAN